MKAAVYRQYGPPEVVSIQEIPKPIPGEDEILIKVFATTVNRTDSGFRSAEYFVSRFWSGLLKPKLPVLGCEFAGEIEGVGQMVSEYKVGDRVFGYDDEKFGGHAEYLIAKETGALALIPEGFSFEMAAPLTEGAHYALGIIRSTKVKKGDHVLVYGATGAIGSAAVQLLKAMEIKVTAVCNSRNLELVKSLGANEVIDYQTNDFTKTTSRFEAVLDCVGKSSFHQCKPLLKSKGSYVSTELGKNGENIWLALITPLFRGKKVLFPIPETKKEDILFLKELAENQKFRPVIDRVAPFEEIVEAHRYVEKGQKTGNVVVRIRATS